MLVPFAYFAFLQA